MMQVNQAPIINNVMSTPVEQAPLRALVVDDEANIRLTLGMCLKADGHTAVTVGTPVEAMEAVARQAFDLIFLDLRLGTENGLDYIEPLLRQNPWTRIIVITAYASVETAIEAMKRGASDYLPKPFEAAQVQLVTRGVAERRQLERRIGTLRAAIGEMDPEADLPTSDSAMQSVLQLARQVAASRAGLLITGEIGTGKTRLAHAIHAWSERAAEPFSVVSCRSSAGNGLEAELFGDVSSDAEPLSWDKLLSKVEYCDRGTLVLEEISELPPHVQPGILRLIEQREFERLNDNTPRRTDVRIIGTSSIDFQQTGRRHGLRADLLLALNVVQIDIPPLRTRPGDILLLAERHLAYFGKRDHVTLPGFTPEVVHVLQQHQWPGNNRELRNVVERAVILCKSGPIGVEHLPPNLINPKSSVSIGDLVSLASVEELHIRRVVASTRSLRQAAGVLGIDSATLVRRMQRYEASDDQPAN